MIPLYALILRYTVSVWLLDTYVVKRAMIQDEYRLVKRKSHEKSSSEEKDDKLSAVFRNSFGKLKKNSRTSASGGGRAGLS